MTNILKFTALVTYVQPSYVKLKKAFNWVVNVFAKTKWKPIDVCKDVTTETRDIEFELVHQDKIESTDAILKELDHRGLRPALYEELLAFVAKYPDREEDSPIVALGSVNRRGGVLYSPFVRRLYLGCGQNSFGWGDSCRFLAVRK